MVNEEKEKEVTLTGNQIAGLLQSERAKINSVAQQLNQIQAIIAEINGSIEALKELGKQKNPQTMVQLGAGVMIEAKIEDCENAKITLPGNIVVNQQREQAIKTLSKQAENAKGQSEELQKQFNQIAANINSLEKIVQTAQRQIRKQQKDN